MTVLEDQIGTRLRRRLYEMCQKVVIEDGDTTDEWAYTGKPTHA